MTPVKAARSDDKAKHATFTRPTGTPIARAARPSPPLANIQLPVAVILRTTDRMMAIASNHRMDTEIWLLPNSAAPSHSITADLPKKEIGYPPVRLRLT